MTKISLSLFFLRAWRFVIPVGNSKGEFGPATKRFFMPWRIDSKSGTDHRRATGLDLETIQRRAPALRAPRKGRDQREMRRPMK
jgi:hypothetical protein